MLRYLHCAMAALCFAIPGACASHQASGEPDSAFQQVDTAAIVAVAIEAFQTSNGPIVEVVANLRCRMPCPHRAAESVLAAYAAQIHAALTHESQPWPPCTWNSQVPDSAAKGLRLTATPPSVRDGIVSISVGAACEDVRFDRPEPFGQATTFQAEFRDGRWRITGILGRVVT